MHIPKLGRKSQTTLEYIAIILVVIGILVIAGAYFKRSLQYKYRESGDAIGGGEQYTP